MNVEWMDGNGKNVWSRSWQTKCVAGVGTGNAEVKTKGLATFKLETERQAGKMVPSGRRGVEVGCAVNVGMAVTM